MDNHSNPRDRLQALLDGAHCRDGGHLGAAEGSHPEAPGEAIGAAHPRLGRIINAIAEVLSDHGDPMRARDVHAEVETLLGEPVRWASVKATLAGNLTARPPDSCG